MKPFPSLGEWLRRDVRQGAYERWRRAKLAAEQAARPCVPKSERPRCGARCRSRDGAPCRAPVVWDDARNAPRNGRCRMHGGLSTGATTAEGRARLSEAGRKGACERWRRWREAS